jgi:hypothetical protein
MFSHPPRALHPFRRQRLVLDRGLAALRSIDLGAGASGQKMRSILKPRFLAILLIFQTVRIQAKTKYFRKAEFEI